MPIYLKNPHSILAVLEKRPRDVIEIRLPSARAGNAWRTVRERAEEIGARLRFGQGTRQNWSHGGRMGEAAVKARPGCALGELFAHGTGVYVALDTVRDPQNLGAVFRTAAFFGVRGILLTRSRSAPLTSAAYDVASGGIEHVPFSIQTNLSRALDVAKDAGLWILGTAEDAPDDLTAISADRTWVLVFGNEETGMRRLTRDKGDAVCRIAPRGAIASLNVSAAAAICIHHLTRGVFNG